jgi:uncharacterized membrane protein YbhN (UPF0104 family)
MGLVFLLSFNRTALEQAGISISQTQALLIVSGLLLAWCVGLFLTQRYAQSLEHFEPRLILKVALIYLPAWLCFGISYGLLFPEMNPTMMGLAIGGFALSWSIGYLAIFAPGGIGVRELALTVIFTGTAYATLSPVLASVHRILWVAAELFMGLVVVVVDALRKKNNDPAQDLTEAQPTE